MKQAVYKRALATARRELQKLYRQREGTERAIARLRQTVITLGRLCREEGPEECLKGVDALGLTEAVQLALQVSDRPLSPPQIRDALEGVGFDIGNASNPIASIHSVLKRLVERGDVHAFVQLNVRGKFVSVEYWWGEEKPRAPWVPYPEPRAAKQTMSDET